MLSGFLAVAAAYRGSAPAIRAPTLTPATPVQPANVRAAVRMAAIAPVAPTQQPELKPPMLSGLAGQALRVEASDIPSKSEFRRIVPSHCFKRDTLRSLGHVAQSAVCTALCAATGLLIPLKAAFLPLWIAYAAVTGTVAMGLWVLAHECGHGAFSDNRLLQDAVGFALHTALLVPYFSWQRSHSVHHMHTNHIYKGETHVPSVIGGRAGVETTGGEKEFALAAKMGEKVHGFYQTFGHLTIGWPTYLLFGLTSGSKYSEDGGVSNHFWPYKPMSKVMWPGKWAAKVVQSTAGCAAMLALLGVWAAKAGAATVMAFYGGPLLVVNAWLIIYTWLQHTDVDVPHLSADAHTYMRGAFLSIDRPYPPLIDWLHHRIGTTHVAHHIDCTIPHYHAQEATAAIAAEWPKAYLYDPTPVHKALWRVACNCLAVERRDDGRYVFTQPW